LVSNNNAAHRAIIFFELLFLIKQRMECQQQSFSSIKEYPPGTTKIKIMGQLLSPIPRFSSIKEYSLIKMEMGTIERGATELLSPSFIPPLCTNFNIGIVAMEDIADKDSTSVFKAIKMEAIMGVVTEAISSETNIVRLSELKNFEKFMDRETQQAQQYFAGIDDIIPAEIAYKGDPLDGRTQVADFFKLYPEIKRCAELRYASITAPTYESSNATAIIRLAGNNGQSLYFGVTFNSNSLPFSIAELLWICGSVHKHYLEGREKKHKRAIRMWEICYSGVPTIARLADGTILFAIRDHN
jgi:hypothetical protein